MARIALAIGGAIAGALLAPFTGGLINPYTGAEIGLTVGGVLGGLLFPGKLPPGPRLNDLIVSTATDGAPIPFGYGQVRVAGNIIWAPPIIESSTTHSVKGGPKQTTYSYTANFAVTFGEGPGQVGRIWFDSKIVYDPTGSTAAITGASEIATSVTIQSTLNPPLNTQVTIAGVGSGYDGKFQVILTGPSSFIVFNPKIGLPTKGAGGTASFAGPTYPKPTIYNGTQTQNADPNIQAFEGASVTPAYRGLIMCVWEGFPLNDFGNRVPNIRAEITYTINPPPPLSPAFVQSASGGGLATSGSLAFANPNGAGNTVLVFIDTNMIFGAGAFNPLAVVTVTDTQGNTYTQVPPGSGGTTAWGFYTGTGHGYSGALFMAINVKAGSNTVRWSVTYGITSGVTLLSTNGIIVEVTGNGLVNPLITSGAVTQTGGPYADPYEVTLATNQPGQLVILFSPLGGSFIPGGGLSPVSGLNYWTIANPITQGYGSTIMNDSTQLIFVAVLSNQPPVPNLPVPTTAQIVQDICTRAGMTASEIDTSLLVSTPTPGGYLVTRPSTAQSCLVPLVSAFFFDGVETNGTLKFVPRGAATQTLVVPEADLGMYKDNYKIVEQIGQIQDLPLNIEVLYNDKALDYQQNHTRKIRHRRIVRTKNETLYELPLTIDSATARQIAEKALFLAYLERHPYDFNLWKSVYLLYDPTDVINFTYEGLSFTMRITKETIGVDFTTAMSGVNENASSYQSSVAGASGVGVMPGKGKVLPDSQLFMFDIPLLRDSDANLTGTGYYFALGSLDTTGSWPGGVLEKSSDNANWAQEDQSSVAVSYGYATTVLPAPPSPWSWDFTSTLTLRMINGTLAGTSMINVLNGSNAMIVGGEVIQFVNAVLNADGTYTLSTLLRGRRGTEIFCNNHGAAELVVFLNNPGIVRHQSTTADLNVLRFFEGLTYGQTPGSVSSTLFTDTGNDLRPYAVTSVAGSRDGSGNLTVTWIRRTRIGGDWLEGTGTVPLSESIESYDVDVINNGNVVRTFAALPSPTLSYTASQQIADFGSKVAGVTLNIYQNNSLVGRGFLKTANV